MDVRCPICLDTVRNPQYSHSRHVACTGCIDSMFVAAAADGTVPLSPNTRTVMTSRDYYGPMYTDAVAVADGGNVRVVLLADCSGSMSGSSANTSSEAAPSRISLMIHFIKMLSSAFGATGFAVMSFSDACTSIDIKDIDALRPSGGTDMVLALTTAVSLHGTEPAFIMFTDGEPAAGTDAQTVAAFRAFGPSLKLHVVGFGPSLNSAVMRELSAHGTNTYINSVATAPIMIASLAAFLIAPRRAVLSIEDECTRATFVTGLGNLIARRETVDGLIAMLRACRPSPYCLALLEDVQSDDIVLGQIAKAVAAPWGAYYLDSIRSAHQQCYAMSDLESSLRFYATDAFTALRDVAMAEMRRTAYVPVVPSDHGPRTRGAIARSTSSFTQDRGGCFAGSTRVLSKKTRSFVRIDSVCIGDELLAFGKDGVVGTGTVLRVVKYVHGGNIALYNDFITAYHPIWRVDAVEGRHYEFPCDMFPLLCSATSEPVYNILLEDGPVGIVAMWRNVTYNCLTLGHGITGDVVASHPYFGTDLVRNDIVAQPIVDGVVYGNLPVRGVSGLVTSMF